MDYKTFLAKEAQLDALSDGEQEKFYAACLREQDPEIRVRAGYGLGSLYFWQGNFRKAIDVVEPVFLNYQSYPYSKTLLGCFNLLATAMQCELEYVSSRFVYGMALRLAKEHGTKGLYAREYNNIASVFVMEKKYSLALAYLDKAEQALPDSEVPMGAFIYLNKAVSYLRLGKTEQARQAYTLAIRGYNAREALPDDTLLCGLSLYYSLGDLENYESLKAKALARLGQMHASEAIETCQNLFECGMDADDEALLRTVLRTMDAYLEAHPEEYHFGQTLAELKYRYAEKNQDSSAMLEALRGGKYYAQLLLAQTERDRIGSMAKNFRITTQLQNALESKERASQAKSRFLRSISHDIRTPLNGIIGLLKVDEAHPEDGALIARNRGRMQLAADHLLSLINDVLDMSRIEEGGVKLAREPVSIPELHRQIVAIVEPTAAENGVTLRLAGALPTSAPWVYGSPNHLRQIFLNIYGNCVKYNRPGGSVTTAVDLTQEAPGRCTCRWTVSDTGIGMSQAFLAHIFEPFEQERSDARSTYNGSGLGMSIAQGLVRQMGGTIAVSSTEGSGSVFTVTIPFETAPAPQAPEAPREKADIRGLRLLLVEDNALNADIARILLTDEGAEIVLAQNGQQALDLFAASKPKQFDAILMDVMMPVMDGLTATRAIRALPRPDAETVPIIAMTANAYTEDAESCLAAGMNAHLGKPLDMAKVTQTIAACCGDGNAK